MDANFPVCMGPGPFFLLNVPRSGRVHRADPCVSHARRAHQTRPRDAFGAAEPLCMDDESRLDDEVGVKFPFFFWK